jgi:hypothetical protein
MSDTPPASAKSVSTGSVILGLLFCVLWIVAHIVWATMSLMGSVMANDSGAASSDQHMSLIGGMLGGQFLAGAAGIPGGLAFFWRSARKWLWISFAILFIAGATWQILAFLSFFSAASSH